MAAPEKQLSATKLWLFRLTALLLVPLLVLGAAELALRLAGYGYPVAFFRPQKIGGAEWLVENDKFGRRFFPSGLARIPAPTAFRETKPPGTYRIFVFGESAALGDPRPAFGVARYLKAILSARYPDARFEVICVAMTAINSYALVDMARECARYQGDLWIIYMGNNEMVGPYGAATVFGAQAPPRLLVKLSLAAQRWRLGQLLAALGEKLHGRSRSGWGGMEMFLQNRVPPGAKSKQVVYHSFQANLADMVDAGRAAGAKVMLSSVAINLRDCPPFASLGRTNFPPAEQAAWQQALQTAATAQTNHDFAAAARALTDAVKLDPTSAELEFRLAENLSRAGAGAEAREHYQQARDDDALPFRTDSRINQLIRAEAQPRGETAQRALSYVDAEGALAQASRGGVPGEEWFYDHVHFNFAGNYFLALTWAKAIESLLPASEKNHATATWPSEPACERRLGLTDWNRVGVLQEVVSRLERPPFAPQPGNGERIAAYQATIAQLRNGMDTNKIQAARQLYHDALQTAEGEHELHENYAEFLEAVGDLAGATREWQRVTELIPQHHLAFLNLGSLLGEQRKFSEAHAALAQVLKLRPDLADGWLELGKLALAEGNPKLALRNLAEAEARAPRDFHIYYERGRALAKLGRHTDAIGEFQRALELNPSFWLARYHAALEMAFAGQNEAALAAFAEVVRLKPDSALGQLNYGVALYKAGRREAARQRFVEALRLDPNSRQAADFLKRLDETENGTGPQR